MDTVDLAKLTREDFEKLTDTVFQIDDLGVAAKLVQVKAGTSQEGISRIPFSLFFQTQGVPQQIPQQGTFHLHHQQLGKLELFMVTIARRAEGLTMEAVFS